MQQGFGLESIAGAIHSHALIGRSSIKTAGSHEHTWFELVPRGVTDSNHRPGGPCCCYTASAACPSIRSRESFLRAPQSTPRADFLIPNRSTRCGTRPDASFRRPTGRPRLGTTESTNEAGQSIRGVIGALRGSKLRAQPVFRYHMPRKQSSLSKLVAVFLASFRTRFFVDVKLITAVVAVARCSTHPAPNTPNQHTPHTPTYSAPSYKMQPSQYTTSGQRLSLLSLPPQSNKHTPWRAKRRRCARPAQHDAGANALLVRFFYGRGFPTCVTKTRLLSVVSSTAVPICVLV